MDFYWRDRRITREDAINIMRTVAWCAEVVNVSGKTEEELQAYSFNADSEFYEFPVYSVGARTPRIETVDIVEKAQDKEEEEEKKRKEAAQRITSSYQKAEDAKPIIQTRGTRQVFVNGPENHPLWALLADKCDEDLCMNVLGDWLALRQANEQVACLSKAEQTSEFRFLKSLPFQQKVEMLWKNLIGDDPVDFEKFEAGEETHRLWIPWLNIKDYLKEIHLDSDGIRTVRDVELLIESRSLDHNIRNDLVRLKGCYLLKRPSLDDAVGVIALKRLAESRRECQSEARYLFTGTLFFMGTLFSEWNIGRLLCEFLEPWSRVRMAPGAVVAVNEVYSDSVAFCRAQMLEKHSAKEKLIYTTLQNRFKR